MTDWATLVAIVAAGRAQTDDDPKAATRYAMEVADGIEREFAARPLLTTGGRGPEVHLTGEEAVSGIFTRAGPLASRFFVAAGSTV